MHSYVHMGEHVPMDPMQRQEYTDKEPCFERVTTKSELSREMTSVYAQLGTRYTSIVPMYVVCRVREYGRQPSRLGRVSMISDLCGELRAYMHRYVYI